MGHKHSRQSPPPQIIYHYTTDPALTNKLADLENQLSAQLKQLKVSREKDANYQNLVTEMDSLTDKFEKNAEQLRQSRIESERSIDQKVIQITVLKDQVEETRREIRHQQKRAEDEKKKRMQEIKKMQAMMNKYAEQMRLAKEQAKKLSDPQQFKKKKDEIFVAFLENLKDYKFTQNLQKNGKRHIILIGNISAGKSSLINNFFNLKLPTGRGETTLSVSKVAESQNTVILDSPGAHDDFEFYDVENLNLFYSVDFVFILYSASLKDLSKILKIMKVIKRKNTYLLRTQCDLFVGGNDEKSLQKELQADRLYLKQTIGYQFPVLATSARKDATHYDNAKTKDLMLGRE